MMRLTMGSDVRSRFPITKQGGNFNVPLHRIVIASQRVRANARPDDRLREAIHDTTSGDMDCFVALLLGRNSWLNGYQAVSALGCSWTVKPSFLRRATSRLALSSTGRRSK